MHLGSQWYAEEYGENGVPGRATGRSEDQCTFTWPKVLSSLKTLGI